MIEFTGELSEESKKYLFTKMSKGALWSILIASAIIAILVFIIAALCDFWILTIFVVACILCDIVAFILFKFKRLNGNEKKLINMLPKSVFIYDDGKIEAIYLNHVVIKAVTDVKIIIDTDTMYYIVFYFPKESDLFCQKDLLVEGTIEEFEELFAGKIRRKNKQNK